MVLRTILYDNIVKISLRKEGRKFQIFFCEVSRRNYGVKKSRLYEHRDVDMHLIVRSSLSFRISVTN